RLLSHVPEFGPKVFRPLCKFSRTTLLEIEGKLATVGSFFFKYFHTTTCTGGGRGIRTPERVTPLTVFKTAGFNHSPIPPISIVADRRVNWLAETPRARFPDAPPFPALRRTRPRRT